MILGHDSGHHIHRDKLLKEQLTTKGDFHVGELGLVLTHLTQMDVLLFVINGDHAASFTDMERIFVGHIVHAFFRKSRGAVGDHTISLHLSEPETTSPASSLCGLPCEINHRPDTPTVLLVVDHVFQALVVDGANEDRGLNLLSGLAIVQDFVALGFIIVFLKLFKDRIHVDLAETGAVAKESQFQEELAQHRLFDLGNGHA
jgi:hypothetical protein